MSSYHLDVFGKDLSEIKSKRLFLFDMDGTIYEDDLLFDGAIPLLEQIKRQNSRSIFITNNSSRSVAEYCVRLQKMGIPIEKDDFFTSTQATILILKEHHRGQKVFCMGTHSLVAELWENGIDVTEEVDDAATLVLIGYDTELTYDKLRKTCMMLQKDVVYLATNPDWTCPTKVGFLPDCGAMCKMLEYACGKWPTFIGKPEPTMIDVVCQNLGIPKSETVIIGDRLYTDIAAGRNAGITSVCVLTGEATLESIKKEAVQPTYTVNSVLELYRSLALGEKR